MVKVQNTPGSSRASPPILKMSCSSASASMITPAARKSRALKKACVMKWNTPASHPDTPSARNM